MNSVTAGINGFGRFGLHLLRYWSLNYDRSQFEIEFINDETLSLLDLVRIVKEDEQFADIVEFDFAQSTLRVDLPNIGVRVIRYTNSPVANLKWLGAPDIFFECSGAYVDNKEQLLKFMTGNTRTILVSATSPICDQTLIYGYNNEDYNPESKLVSYGSCTVNAFVPLAAAINERFGVLESDMQVIHNVPEYKLLEYPEPVRRDCTLQTAAPSLLDFLSPDNFQVNYTLIPYTGVSLMYLRFRLRGTVGLDVLMKFLQAMARSSGQYEVIETDTGSAAHKFSDASAVLVGSTVVTRGTNIYIQAYFDNENSVNRYFDVANYILSKRT